MKRLLFPVAATTVAVVAVVPLAPAQAEPASAEAATRAVCHRTSSAARPYVKLRVGARQHRAHLRHAADTVQARARPGPSSYRSARLTHPAPRRDARTSRARSWRGFSATARATT